MSGKRVRIDTNLQPKKKKCGNKSFVGDGDDDDDRISQLPDDILVNILSLLSMKEAGRTSVLSPRWINLWKHTPSLDFDAESELEEIMKQPKLRSQLFNSGAFRKYPEWVSSVIRSHKSPTLKLFRIRFPLDTSYRHSVTWWLQFACCRQVQRLEFDFPDCNKWSAYNRSAKVLFDPRSGILLEFKSLRALSFKNVTLSNGAIEFFLRKCPLLEQLIVHWPRNISKLEVRGSSLVLKHLEIVHCDLESLKISAPTLTSLKVTSIKGVLLENVPILVNLSVCFENDSVSVNRLLSLLCCCVSELESLNLVLRRSYGRRATDELCLRNLPEMPKLKKLVIDYGLSGGDGSLIRLASLTKASPYLHEFVLKNKWSEGGMTIRQAEDVVEDAAAFIRFRHEHLKVFKFCGYHGRPSDDALVRYILENCVVLERIIIDPSTLFCRDKLLVEEAARKNAKQHLKPLFPHHIEFVVL